MKTTESADGTVIAYDRTGDGPPLIVSVGAFCTRRTFVPPEPLTSRFTVYTYDRRGRGDSGDTQPYAVEREYEDLAAVAAATGEDAPFLYGHSSGAAVALRTAASGAARFAAIAAYEAPFDAPEVPGDPAGHIRELVRTGRRGEAVMYWMSEVVRLPAEMTLPAPWMKALEPLTPTLPYDIALTEGGVPFEELARITAPVLILGGAKSPTWFRRSVMDQTAATPGARLVQVDGYDHNVPSEVISPILIDFFSRR